MNEVNPVPLSDPNSKTLEEKLEAKRNYHHNKYYNDPAFRQRQLESNRKAGAKIRAVAREEKARLIALGELTPKRPGRPRTNTAAVNYPNLKYAE